MSQQGSNNSDFVLCSAGDQDEFWVHILELLDTSKVDFTILIDVIRHFTMGMSPCAKHLRIQRIVKDWILTAHS